MRYLIAFLVFAAQAAPLQWEPGDHGLAMQISGYSVSRTSGAGPFWQMARSVTPQSSGVRTVQFAIDAIGSTAGGAMVGVLNTKAAAPLGSSAYSIGYANNGNTTCGGGWCGIQPGAYGVGDIVGIQVDFTAKTVRFQRNAGPWSAAVSTANLGPDLYIGVSLAGLYGPSAVHIVSEDWTDFTEPTLNVVFVGDSITVNSVVLKNFVPRFAEAILAQRKGWARVTKAAVNGASWDYAWGSSGYPYTLIQDVPVRVAPALSPVLPNWVVGWAGTNGIQIARHDAAYEYNKAIAWVNAIKALGVAADHIVICTMLPRNGTSEVTRNDYNARLVAGAATNGYRVARVDLIPQLANPADPAYYSDGVHPTDAGHDLIWPVIAGVIFP